MAERVVDFLEPVEIEAQDGRRYPAAAAARRGLVEPVLQQHAVGQAGECVVMGEKARLLEGTDLGGDVGGDAAVAEERPVTPYGLARDAQHVVFAAARLSPIDGVGEWSHGGELGDVVGLGGRPVLRPEQLEQRSADQLLRVELERALAGIRDECQSQLGIGLPDPVRGRLRDVAEPRLALTDLAIDTVAGVDQQCRDAAEQDRPEQPRQHQKQLGPTGVGWSPLDIGRSRAGEARKYRSWPRGIRRLGVEVQTCQPEIRAKVGEKLFRQALREHQRTVAASRHGQRRAGLGHDRSSGRGVEPVHTVEHGEGCRPIVAVELGDQERQLRAEAVARCVGVAGAFDLTEDAPAVLVEHQGQVVAETLIDVAAHIRVGPVGVRLKHQVVDRIVPPGVVPDFVGQRAGDGADTLGNGPCLSRCSASWRCTER